MWDAQGCGASDVACILELILVFLQIDFYLADQLGSADPDDVYLVDFGSNGELSRRFILWITALALHRAAKYCHCMSQISYRLC